MRAESRRIQRDYEERQLKIQALLERIVSDVERA
jgi:uridine kinase